MFNKVSVLQSESTTTAAFSESESSSKLKGSSLPSSTVLAIAFKRWPLQNKSDVRVDISVEVQVGLTLHSNGGEI